MKNLKIFGIIALVVAFVFAPVAGIGMGVISYLMGPERQRKLFNALKSISEVSCQQSYLRQEATISNSQGVYKFDFSNVNNTPSTSLPPQLVLLDKNDLFVCTHVGVYLYEADSTTVGYVRDGLQTYVNPLYFVAAAGFVPGHLNQVYQGKLKYKVASTEVLESIDLGLACRQPDRQGITAATVVGSQNPEDGLIDLASFPFINGSQQTIFILDLPIFTGITWAAVAANKSNVLVVKPHGVLVKGGARYVEQVSQVVDLIQA